MSISGIDVSHHQAPDSMDYGGVASLHQFLIARASYGVRPDATFLDHAHGARDAGLVVGSYLFFRQQQDWEQQFDALEEQLGDLEGLERMIAPALDLEWNDAYDGPVDKNKHNTSGRALAEKIAETYGKCLIYLAPGFYQTLGEPQWLLDFPWWIAHYTSKPEPWCPWKRWAIWQFTGKGVTPGYGGPSDLNRLHTQQELDELLVDVDPRPGDQELQRKRAQRFLRQADRLIGRLDLK